MINDSDEKKAPFRKLDFWDYCSQVRLECERYDSDMSVYMWAKAANLDNLPLWLTIRVKAGRLRVFVASHRLYAQL